MEDEPRFKFANEFPQSDGGWARYIPQKSTIDANHSRDAEITTRQTAQANDKKPSLQHNSKAKFSINKSEFQRPRTTERNGILQPRIVSSGAAQNRQRSIDEAWNCPSCNERNFHAAHCSGCQRRRPFVQPATREDISPHSFKSPHQEHESISQDWKHIRRLGSIDTLARQTDKKVEDSRANQELIEHARQQRLEQTKDGAFVKLNIRRTRTSPVSETSSQTGWRSWNQEVPILAETTSKPARMNDAPYRDQRPNAPYVRGATRDRERRKPRYRSEYEDDEDDRLADRIEKKRQRKKERALQKLSAPPTPIYLPEYISVSNLAAVLKVRVEDFGRKMRALGFEETHHDHILDAETAGLISAEFNFEPKVADNEGEDLYPQPAAEDKSLLPARPPIVTIMGHVDHGKTTLLDWLRKSSVAASEHGGITQHIGAFSVSMPGGRLITFLDTPGHAAFLSMRERGANVTDIVILVVAADDSVMPQTIEAIKHSQAAKVPMIVAVNKIDKGDANVDHVKQDLARHGVDIEDYGGDTQVVCVSGKTGQGMEALEEAAIALADVLDMRAEINGQAEGWVLEATKKKAGRVATVLVRRGTIRPGDVIVAGSAWGKVRSLRNEAGVQLSAAGPGTPVEIDGWREQPNAGDEVLQAQDERQARSVVHHRIEVSDRDHLASDMAAVNETRRIEQEKREQEKKEEMEATLDKSVNPEVPGSSPRVKEVYFIVKADVSGSAEAVVNSISALGNSEVRPHILRSGVGPVVEFDVEHAATAKGYIISFNTTIEGHILRLAETSGVKILDQSIIYRLVDDVKAKLSEELPPSVTQRVLGEAEVAQVFDINIKKRITVPIAGCKIRNGSIVKNAKVKVLRSNQVVYDGIPSLPLSPHFCNQLD